MKKRTPLECNFGRRVSDFHSQNSLNYSVFFTAVQSGAVILIVATSGGLYYLWRSSAHVKDES